MDQGEQPGEVAARGRHPTVASERTGHRGNLGPWGRGGSEPQVDGIWARYFRMGRAPSHGQPYCHGEQAKLYGNWPQAVEAMRIGLRARASTNKLGHRSFYQSGPSSTSHERRTRPLIRGDSSLSRAVLPFVRGDKFKGSFPAHKYPGDASQMDRHGLGIV